MGKTFRILVFILLFGGAASLCYGFWIPAKALVAQCLLNRAWEETVATGASTRPWPWADTVPVGRLQLERLGVRMIVLAGTNGESLAFGPGLHPESAVPGSSGHSVLFGHRDTSFKFLQEVEVGDVITFESPSAARTFKVVSRSVVKDDNLYFNLDSEGVSLITCYPFEAINPNAGDRFVVTAVPLSG